MDNIEVDIEMSKNGNTKKRRVAAGGARVSIDGDVESGGGSELAAIKSMMQELVQQNRTQTNMINNMQAEITQLSKKCMSQNRTQTNMMQSIQGDITRLTKKYDTFETTMKSVKLSQGKSLAAIKTLQSDNTQLDMNLRFDKLEQTIKKKDIKLDDRLKYHDILLQNQKWVYSAPRPSTEYWSTLDEDEQAEKFLKQIQQCTEEMRYGTGDGKFEINADIPYNEELLPHWKEFANALEQYHHHLKQTPELRDNAELHLFNMEMPDEVIDLLSKALKSTHFKYYTIMKQFTVVYNPINSMDDINKLCKILKEHPSIEILALSGCSGEDINGYEMLQLVMNAGKNKLKNVRLSKNNISTEGGGGTFISDFLAKSTVLQALTLEGNQLDDQDAIGIAGALKHNANLRFLRLVRNGIAKTGWKALRKAEFDDSSLNAAADSNHRCSIKYPPDGSDLIDGLDIIEMNGDRNFTKAFESRGVRRKKIYSVLSTRNRDCSNVKHFGNIPVDYYRIC